MEKKRFISGIGGWCRWWWWLLPEKNQLGRDPFIFCQQLQLSPFQLEEIGSNSWTDNQTNWCSHTDFFFTYDTPIIELTIDIAKQCHLICHPIKFWQGTTFTVLAMVLYDVEAYWPARTSRWEMPWRRANGLEARWQIARAPRAHGTFVKEAIVREYQVLLTPCSTMQCNRYWPFLASIE